MVKKKITCGDGEGLASAVWVAVVVEEGGGVEDVGGAGGGEGEAGPEDVVDSATEDAGDCEGGVEGGQGVVRRGGVHLPATAHPRQRVEHSRAAEAHHADQDHLDQRRVVPE